MVSLSPRMDILKVFAFVLCVLIHSGMKEADAVELSSTVVPSEMRRQGIPQQHPCGGDTLNFVCILNGSSTTGMRWIVGENIYTLLVAIDIGVIRNNAPGVNSTFVNQTFSTLQIRLAEATFVMNGSLIGCQELVPEIIPIQNESLTVIGTASSPTVSVCNNSLSRLIVDMTVPVYGRECVDSYRATAVVGEVTREPVSEEVVDPTQDVYTLVIPGVDLCRDTFTNITVVGVTDGVEGMATLVTVDDIDRTTIINSSVLSSQLFTASGVNFVLSWQVVDEGIEPNGFQVTCFVEDNPISCAVQGTTVTQRTVVMPYNNDLIGANFTFSVNYSYEMCISESFSTSIRVVSLLASGPVVVTEQRAVDVTFNDAVLDNTASRVMFSSTCTESKTLDYETNLRITIPDTLSDIESDANRCQYTIQLMDGSSRPIGPPITGFFNVTGLPPAPTTTMAPGTSANNAAAIGGGVGGGVAAAVAAGVVITVVVGTIVYKKKKGKKGTCKQVDTGDGGEDNTDAKVELATYADPNSIEHQQAPGGEEYAMIAKKKPEVSGALYQDPHTIQHQEAAGGDLYTVVDKPKKASKKTKESSVDQSAPVYSMPDKSRKNQDKLTYADIDLPRGGAIPTQYQTEYSSLVN